MRIRSLAGVACLVISLVGCTTGPASPTPLATTPTSTGPLGASPGPSPAASQDALAIYAAIRAQVEAIRGLRPTIDIAPALIDETQLRANLTADFDRENAPATIAATQRILIALGLLPAGSSLRSLVLDLDSGQVAGYYSPDQKQLFVVSRSGTIGPTERVTYAHEFTHELQDQTFNLSSLKLDAADQGDRSTARLALIEGDAVSVQTTWLGKELTAADIAQIVADATDPAAVAALQNAPAYLQQTALFPYQDGLQFVDELIAAGGYAAVNAAFARPPDSTEQILHPEKYAADEKPIVVTPAGDLASRLGSGWTAGAQDTLGELVLRIWLSAGGLARADANIAAAGWGGDRLVLLSGPSGATTVVLESAWDSAKDAGEFAAAARTALGGLGLKGTVVHKAGSSRVSLAIGPDTGALASVLPG